MTREVLLSIKGFQVIGETKEETGGEEIEVVAPGKYRFQNEKHFVSYEEVIEGSSEKIQNLIKISDDIVEVTKRGFTNVHMVFEKNKRNMSYYDTPFGKFLVSIIAKNIQVIKEQGQISTRVDYSLDINYEHMADCTIEIKINAKNGTPFHLSETAK